MAFRIAQKTLERLEWPEIVARLRAHCRTPQARRRLAPPRAPEDSEDAASVAAHADAVDAVDRLDGLDEPEAAERTAGVAAAPEATLFVESLAGVRERLAETSEARALIDGEEFPPLGGAMELELSFRRAAKGGALTGTQLLDVASTLAALHASRRFLVSRAETAPGLAALAETIEDESALQRAIESAIEPSGEVRDGASPGLRAARNEASGLAGELQRRLGRILQDSRVAEALSDSYFTVRNDRYVLPVRADMRGRVKGIVHDASGSGTTLFVEPEALVELNNRLKQAELAVAREVQQVLQGLSGRVAAALEPLRAGLAMLECIDLAFARGRLSAEMRAVEPEVGRDCAFVLPQLRHPLLPVDEAVPNDVRLGEGFHVMVISGPNGGGKTVVMKATALAALLVRAGLHVPADAGARVDAVDTILADIGDEQNIRESLSTFSAHLANVASIVAEAGPHTLVVLDEVGVGTDPSEGASLAQAVLEGLADKGARVIATTHYNLLKEMASVDSRFCNASVEFDPESLAPTYRLHMGTPGISSAMAVAARMGMPRGVLDRANALVEREDRRLDQMLSELAHHRVSLEREQREAAELRREGEVVRDEYRHKLERLQERRDKLFHEMRDDLDRAFKDAHAQVAGVIRDLQRGGSARDAARARERLQSLETRAREAEEKTGIQPREAPAPELAVDWRRAKPGDAVIVPGGQPGVLEALPDRRGRAAVRVGAARLVVEAERLRRTPKASEAGKGGGAHDKRAESHIRVERAGPVADATSQGLRAGDILHCDLRGERVEAALVRVADALDRAARDGHDGVRFVHGFGTGALRSAVREHLQTSPYVADFEAADVEQGGDGVTLAHLRLGAREG